MEHDDRRPLLPWWPRAEVPSPSRLVRIPDRGLATVAALGVTTLAWVALAGSMVLAALGAPLAMAVVAGAVLATATVLLLRAWSIGTYVNDEGFVVRRLASRRAGRWDEVTGIEVGPHRVVIRVGTATVATHVARWSLDILGSSQAYEIAADRLIRWCPPQEDSRHHPE